MPPRSTLAKTLAAAVTAASLLLAAPAALAGTDDGDDGRSEPTRAEGESRPPELAGTLRLYGCDLPGEAIELRAQPLALGGVNGRRQPPASPAAERRTRLVATGTPHVYRFSILGLRPASLYRLEVRLHPVDACGTVLWRAPADGLAVSGGPPVALEGFAVTTTVEVRDEGGAWVGADALKVDDGSVGPRLFRWRSKLPGVTGGKLLVSTDPFPVGAPVPDPCAEPEGVVHTQALGVRGGGDEHQLVALDVAGILRDVGADGGGTALRPFEAGAPLYVRVVPVLPDGPGCDPEQHGLPGTTALAKLPAGQEPTLPPPPLPPVVPGDGHTYTPPYVGGPAEGHPTYTEQAYKVIRPHTLPAKDCLQTLNLKAYLGDPLGCMLVAWGVPGGTTIQPGDWFFFAPSSGGGSSDPFSAFVSSLGNLGAALYAGAGLAVNAASEAWEEIKATVVKVVVDVAMWIPGVGPACDALASTGATNCTAIVRAGLEVGLMAMGVPPSIPNWEQLQQDGIDYLAAEMATQIEASTGVPSPLTEEALKQLAAEAMTRMDATRGAGPAPAFDWVIPYLGIEPAVLRVTLRQPGHASIPDGYRLVKLQDPIYAGAEVPIPRLFPASDELRFPIVLQPRLDVFGAPLCRSYLFVTCTENAFLSAPLCQYGDASGQQLEWKTYPCGNQPAIYYRDRWRTESLPKFACVRLRAVSFLTGFLGVPVPAGDATFELDAWVKPTVPATWNGATFDACA